MSYVHWRRYTGLAVAMKINPVPGVGSTRRAMILLLALVAGSASWSGAQVPETPQGGPQVPGTRQGGAQVPAATEPSRGEPQPLLVDAPVRRAEYQLGPGDMLQLSIFGDLNRMYPLTVTPEGTVVIPGVGVAEVLGLNLNEAEARVRQQVFRFFRNVDVHLTLAGIRQFRVFVVGDVAEQGMRVASSVTRVSEVVPQDTSTDVLRRNVVLRRSTGDSLTVDLARFRQTGDLSANPALREGDVLVVPAIDETVQVFGRVAYPGTYEYRRGENLADLLEVATGARGFPSDAADSVRVSRFPGTGEREMYVLSLEEARGPRGRSLMLQPFDAVFVPALANFMRQQAATVMGQVARPGTYPIRPDTTTVRDLVEMAGGFTTQASLVDATLRRQPQPAASRGARQLENIPPELLTREELRIMQIRAQSDEGNVVVDFQRLFAEGYDAYNQVLQPGDTLEVPVSRNEITVLGAVANPGIVRYSPEWGVSQFVALAGGYTRRASPGNMVVLRSRLGTRVDARDVRRFDPGDIIIVPFQEERNWLQALQTTNAIVGTITSVMLAITVLTR